MKTIDAVAIGVAVVAVGAGAYLYVNRNAPAAGSVPATTNQKPATTTSPTTDPQGPDFRQVGATVGSFVDLLKGWIWPPGGGASAADSSVSV